MGSLAAWPPVYEIRVERWSPHEKAACQAGRFHLDCLVGLAQAVRTHPAHRHATRARRRSADASRFRRGRRPGGLPGPADLRHPTAAARCVPIAVAAGVRRSGCCGCGRSDSGCPGSDWPFPGDLAGRPCRPVRTAAGRPDCWRLEPVSLRDEPPEFIELPEPPWFLLLVLSCVMEPPLPCSSKCRQVPAFAVWRSPAMPTIGATRTLLSVASYAIP